MLLPFLLAAETFLSAHFVLSSSTLSPPPTDKSHACQIHSSAVSSYDQNSTRSSRHNELPAGSTNMCAPTATPAPQPLGPGRGCDASTAIGHAVETILNDLRKVCVMRSHNTWCRN